MARKQSPRRHRFDEKGECACGAKRQSFGRWVVNVCTRPRLTPEELRARRHGYMKNFHVRQALSGRCNDCMEPAEEGSIWCRKHHKASLDAKRAKRRKNGVPERYACPCGKPGHYVCFEEEPRRA